MFVFVLSAKDNKINYIIKLVLFALVVEHAKISE